MINTGDNRIKSNSKLYITNTINNQNIERAQIAYSNANIYIDKKFELPTEKYKELSVNNEQIDNYIEQVISLNNILGGIADTIRLKVKYWFTEWVLKEINRKGIVFIDTPLSKHEWIAVGLINNLGLDGFIVSDTKSSYKIPGINYGEITCKVEEFEDDGVSLNYKINDNELKSYINQDKSDLTTIDSILNEFKSNVCASATIINGWTDNQEDTSELSKIIKSYEKGCIVIKNKFEQPMMKDIQTITVYGDYLNIINNISGILSRLVGEGIKNFDMQSILKAIINEFNGIKNTYNNTQLKNKLVVTLSTLASLMRNSSIKHIVFLGVPCFNDRLILKILKSSNYYNLLVIHSDLTNKISIQGINTITLEESIDSNKFLSLIESNNVSRTLAASVETSVNSTVYGNNTIGLYKPGQFDYANCIRFKTTFDEIVNWINEDAFVRPGYTTEGSRVTLPTMFKIIMGIKDGMDGVNNPYQSDLASDAVKQYTRYISRQFNYNSILFKSFDDLEKSLYTQSFGEGIYTFKIEGATNKRDYIESQTKLFNGKELNRKAITSSRFYSYGLLSDNKQAMLLDIIERILVGDYIDYKRYNITYEKYVDTVMQLLLTIHPSIINKVHAFNLYGKVPRIIVVSATDTNDTLRYLLQSAIMLCALSLMGFDILIYVPTAYNNLNSVYTDKFNIDVHIIGDPVIDSNLLCRIPYDIKSLPVLNTNSIANYDAVNQNSYENSICQGESNKKKKEGFFKRLFK